LSYAENDRSSSCWALDGVDSILRTVRSMCPRISLAATCHHDNPMKPRSGSPFRGLGRQFGL
jgi:hypothetical protein